MRARLRRAPAPVTSANRVPVIFEIEIENAELRAQVPVRLRCEVEMRLLPPRALDTIGRFIRTDGDALVRNIRHVQLEDFERLLDRGQRGIELLDLVADALHRVDLRRRVLFRFLQRGDLLRSGIALALQRFDADDRAATLRFQLEESIEVDFRAAVLQCLTVQVCVFAQEFTGQHGRE
jgi:hypothetical protein